MHVSALTVYPIKSCAGISVTRWPLERRGLRHDRSFMVVDGEGTFLTQREHPALALVHPQIDDDRLTIHAPGRSPVAIDLTATGSTRTDVTLWEFTGTAVDAGDEAAALFTDHLGTAVRLVAMPADLPREADPDYAGAGHPVGFADGFPLLVTNEASLADLNGRMADALPMQRFRPNIVVADAPAYAEDNWRTVRVGAIDVDVVKACARCTITTVDPDTGTRDGGEPLRTLGTYRRGERGVLFGQNAVPRSTGVVQIGDPIEVLR